MAQHWDTQELYKEHIKKAFEFWSKIADKNGWSMEGRKVQVWVDVDGQEIDSIYLPEGAEKNLIVSYTSEEILEVFP
jgi:hypothetical protein